MDFLGNILAVHLVQDILERGTMSLLSRRVVDTVIHGDIADTVSWEKSSIKCPVCGWLRAQSAEVFRDDKG